MNAGSKSDAGKPFGPFTSACYRASFTARMRTDVLGVKEQHCGGKKESSVKLSKKKSIHWEHKAGEKQRSD